MSLVTDRCDIYCTNGGELLLNLGYGITCMMLAVLLTKQIVIIMRFFLVFITVSRETNKYSLSRVAYSIYVMDHILSSAVVISSLASIFFSESGVSLLPLQLRSMFPIW